jgi:hypothetical protein
MSSTAHEGISPAKEEARQKKQREELESWAVKRLKLWGTPRQDDYDFRSWAKGASKNCLHAGVAYEYARESRKLRCLVALMNPKRRREAWEIVRPGLIEGRTPEPADIDSYPAEANWLPCSFEHLTKYDAERALRGFLYCLVDLADDLADNVSFGELYRTKRDELEKAFGGLNELTRVREEFGHFMPIFAPVDVATRSEAEKATVLETIGRDEQRLIHGEPCSEVIAIRVRWRFTNSDIAAGLKKIVCEHRPQNNAYKARQPKKGSRRDSATARLDYLSAMRLASHLPKTSPVPNKPSLAAFLSGDSIQFPRSAIDLFQEIRLGGRGNLIAESNFDALIVEARTVFKDSFPFGEDGANAPTLAERIMMKSARIS